MWTSVKISVDSRYARYGEFIRSIPDRFDREGEYLHRGRNTIKAFACGGLTLVVKKYKVPNPFNRFVYTFFRKDKARRAYEHAQELQRRGFETPEAVAWIRIARNGLFADGYFVSLHCDYLSLLPVLNPEAPKRAFSENVAVCDALVRFIVSLHEAGVLHEDLNQTNILYMPADGGFRFALIDINRMEFRKRLSRRRCMSNLDRLGCDLDAFYYISRNYSRIRGWDQTAGLLESVLGRWLFEKRQRDKARLKKRLGRTERGRLSQFVPFEMGGDPDPEIQGRDDT